MRPRRQTPANACYSSRVTIAREICVETGEMPEEKRRNRRCPVLEGEDSVRIQIGEASYHGELVDISAEGFAITVADMPVPRRGQQFEIECRTGRHEVSVARWEPDNRRLLVGLKRVRDLTDEDPRVTETMPQEKLLDKKLQPAPASVLVALSFCLLVLVAAVVLRFGQEQISLVELFSALRPGAR